MVNKMMSGIGLAVCVIMAVTCSVPVRNAAVVPSLSVRQVAGNKPTSYQQNEQADSPDRVQPLGLLQARAASTGPAVSGSNKYADTFTYNRPLGWLPPPWMPWAQETWLQPTTTGPTHLTTPPPADPNTGRPLIGLNHVTSVHRNVEKLGAGKMLATLLPSVMGTTAGTGILGSMFGEMFEIFNPDGDSAKILVAMGSGFLDTIGGGLIGIPGFSLFKTLLGGVFEDAVSTAVKFVANAATTQNPSSAASAAGDMLSDLIGAIGGDELLGAPDTEGFISNILAAGGTVGQMGLELLVSSLNDPNSLVRNVADFVQSTVSNLPVAPQPSAVAYASASLLQISTASVSRETGPAQRRSLQVFENPMLPTFADVYVRPGVRVGGEIVPAGRVGGWHQATDMRGPHPGIITSYGQWYPLPWTPYFQEYPYGAVPFQQTQYGAAYRRLGGADGGSKTGDKSLTADDLEHIPPLTGTSHRLADAQKKWKASPTLTAHEMSDVLQQVTSLVVPEVSSTGDEVARAPIEDLFSQLMDVLAGSDELTVNPAWIKFKTRLGGLADIWGDYSMSVLEPDQLGVKGLHDVFQSFLNSVALESEILGIPQWKSFLDNLDAVMAVGASAALKAAQGKIRDDPKKLAVGLETGVNAVLARMVRDGVLSGSRFKNKSAGETLPIAMVKLGKPLPSPTRPQPSFKARVGGTELRRLRQS